MTRSVEEWIDGVSKVDWNGNLRSLPQCDTLVRRLIGSGMLRRLLNQVSGEPRLVRLCEQLQGLKKIVLIDDKCRDIRLRLHLFENYEFDVAHNHKWSFHSTILSGRYLQSLHGEVRDDMSALDIQSMSVVTATEYRTLDSYFLRHSMVHSLRAEPHTVTLVIRGPIMRAQSLWRDLKNSKAWVHKGDATDTLKRPLTEEEAITTVECIRQRIAHILEDSR